MYLERYRSNVTSLAITKCRTIFLPVKIIKLNFPPEKWALGTILRKLSFTVKQVLISRRLEWEMLQGLGQKQFFRVKLQTNIVDQPHYLNSCHSYPLRLISSRALQILFKEKFNSSLLGLQFTWSWYQVSDSQWIIMSSLSEYALLPVSQNIGTLRLLFPASLDCKSEGFCSGFSIFCKLDHLIGNYYGYFLV